MKSTTLQKPSTALETVPVSGLLPDDYTLKLCETLAAWRYADLPAAIVHQLKLFLLDTFGVIGGAAHAPGIPELNSRLSRWELTGSATGLIGKRRYSPPTAALANGAAAHALDFDDQHDPARVHANCVVLPTLLATAQDAHPVSGKDFLLAYAISAELDARLGLACYNSIGKGWHPTMVFGTVAASLGAASLLKLNPSGMRDALGMAFHQTSGSAQSMRDGVISKRLGPGFAARAAVLGAFLASDGLSGTRRPLEGDAGLFALYERGEVKTDLITEGLGRHWRIAEYSFKPYPCCRCNHTAIGLAIQLHERGVQADSVTHIQIGMGNVNWVTVGAPYEAQLNSVVHAQFNVAYSFARALIDGEIDLRSYQLPAIGDAAVAALAARITVIDDTSIDPGALEPAWAKVSLTDGNVLELRSNTVKGSPDEPMSEDELLQKFYACLASGASASPADANRLADAIMTLESAPDASAALVDVFPDTQ